MPQPKVSTLQRKVDQMHQLALELGYFCTSAVSYQKDLASTIASSIRPRSGTLVYQSVAISLANIPLEFARQTFFFATQEPETVLGTTTWTVPAMDNTSAVFGFIFQDASPSCTGASKAFKTPSEPVVRVIATIMPGAIISHVLNKRGMSKLCASPFEPRPCPRSTLARPLEGSVLGIAHTLTVPVRTLCNRT